MMASKTALTITTDFIQSVLPTRSCGARPTGYYQRTGQSKLGARLN